MKTWKNWSVPDQRHWIALNLLEGGMMRPADAATFLGISRAAVSRKMDRRRIRVFVWEGVRFLSFMDVLEWGLRSSWCNVNGKLLDVDRKKLFESSESRFSGLSKTEKTEYRK